MRSPGRKTEPSGTSRHGPIHGDADGEAAPALAPEAEAEVGRVVACAADEPLEEEEDGRAVEEEEAEEEEAGLTAGGAADPPLLRGSRPFLARAAACAFAAAPTSTRPVGSLNVKEGVVPGALLPPFAALLSCLEAPLPPAPLPPVPADAATPPLALPPVVAPAAAADAAGLLDMPEPRPASPSAAALLVLLLEQLRLRSAAAGSRPPAGAASSAIVAVALPARGGCEEEEEEEAAEGGHCVTGFGATSRNPATITSRRPTGRPGPLSAATVAAPLLLLLAPRAWVSVDSDRESAGCSRGCGCGRPDVPASARAASSGGPLALAVAADAVGEGCTPIEPAAPGTACAAEGRLPTVACAGAAVACAGAAAAPELELVDGRRSLRSVGTGAVATAAGPAIAPAVARSPPLPAAPPAAAGVRLSFSAKSPVALAALLARRRFRGRPSSATSAAVVAAPTPSAAPPAADASAASSKAPAVLPS